ncbi:hypothetical protein NMG60_11024135 [Bertholletia excelsa]
MWMTGYNDGGDPFNGRKLRPLVPRATTCFSSASRNAPTFSRFQGTDLLSFNHHLGTGAEQSRKELNGQQQQVVVSSRWNPTPEQLQTLEELYRRGTRTPSADQIQHITAQLRRYGKIEGKNVFYWFQNHKARERQKRRRQLESATDEHIHDVETTERNGSGGNKTGFEAGQTKSCWALPTNCSTLAEKNASMQRAATKAAVAECRTEGWVLFNEGELQQRRGLLERNGTWQMMQMSCSSPSTHLINYAPCTIPTQHSTALTCTGPSHETITTMTPSSRRPLINTSTTFLGNHTQKKTPDKPFNCFLFAVAAKAMITLLTRRRQRYLLPPPALAPPRLTSSLSSFR